MPSTRFEEMYNEDLRRAERQMVFEALRRRRGTAGRRHLLSVLLWVFGLH